MEENKKDTAPEAEAPKAEATPAGETTETEKKEKKDKKFFHKEQKELEAAKAQLAEKENQYLRLYAEYENFRKRSEKEKTDCYNTAYGDALTAFLPLIDSMTQALQFSPEDQGIKALAKQLSDILAKLNITEIESDGAQFDPNVHNAIMHEENPELGENVVTQTFQKGYKRGDKVLRCAMVKVAN
ncbi:MAG: nucleotide exchange factor GrpE [Clostridia bacterium]|nr:nucleotide exchange factor GrpE [Clostridia bacterium]